MTFVLQNLISSSRVIVDISTKSEDILRTGQMNTSKTLLPAWRHKSPEALLLLLFKRVLKEHISLMDHEASGWIIRASDGSLQQLNAALQDSF